MTRIPKTIKDQDRHEPPLRLAHVLFILWVAGSVAWALFAAKLANGWGWWVSAPLMAAGLILVLPVLAHLLALFTIRISGNPQFAWRQPQT